MLVTERTSGWEMGGEVKGDANALVQCPINFA